MWKSSILLFLFGISFWEFEELELAMDSFPFNPMVVILVPSPESDPKSYWVVAIVFCFPLLLNFFGFISGWSLQQWASLWPSLEQCLHVNFSPSFMIDAFLFPLPLKPFYFPLLLNGFLLPSFGVFFPLASRWVDCTHTSSKLLVLNIRIICLR